MRPSITLLSAALLCAFSAPVFASGDDGLVHNRFASEFRPAKPAVYGSGQLGVVPGSYWRVYLYLAYQAGKGKPLTAQQIGQLNLKDWHVGTNSSWDYAYEPDKNGSGDWLRARAPLAKQWNLPAEMPLEIMGEAVDGEAFVNCNMDAFKQASLTLKARTAGKPDPSHKAWLQGQDAVFTNCTEVAQPYGQPYKPRAAVLPPALPANAPDWLKYDHAYQSAAANFYSRNFDAARKQFQDIAANPKSPWQPIAPYLAARTLIRKATLQFPIEPGKPAAKARVEALATARKELEALGPTYAPARDLVSLVDARLDHVSRIAALGRALDRDAYSAATPRQLADYLVLLDKEEEKTIDAKEPLTAWIASMQNKAPALATARKYLAAQSDPLWLAPLLANAKPGELTAAEKKAAAAVPATHPLYLTLQYNLLRLAVADKQLDAADKELDRLMAAHGKSMSVATTNRFLELKMLTATTRDAFMKAAIRNIDPVETGEPIDAAAKPPGPDAAADFRASVLRYMPMEELKAISKHPSLPATWKASLPEIMFTRALILNDEATALELLDTVAKPRKTTAHLYTRYRSAASGAERKLAATLILVNTPELDPHVMDSAGASRFWGCKTGGFQESGAGGSTAQAPRYLSPALLAAAAKEQQVLLSLPLRSEYIAPSLLEWAAKKPADEEAPKGLHFLVASTRMECPYGAAKPEKEQMRAKYSRQAYDMVRKLYPDTKWAKQTKYFY